MFGCFLCFLFFGPQIAPQNPIKTMLISDCFLISLVMAMFGDVGRFLMPKLGQSEFPKGHFLFGTLTPIGFSDFESLSPQ